MTHSRSVFLSLLFGITLGVFFRINSFIKVDLLFFKALGVIFLNLIKMMAAPLIFFSTVDAILSMGDSAESRKTIYKSLVIFLFTTILCVICGIISISIFKPGYNVAFDVEDFIKHSGYSHPVYLKQTTSSFYNFVLDVVPYNIMESFLRGNFLQIMFLAIIVAVSVVRSREDFAGFKVGIKSLSKITMHAIKMLMSISPIAIFGTAVWLVGSQDVNLIKALSFYITLNYFNAFFILFICYGLIIFVFARVNPWMFFLKMRSVQLMAYVTDSTAVTMPIAMDVARGKIGVSKRVVDLVMPMGMAVNMNGGALYIGGCAIFLTQIFNIDMNIYKYLTLIIMATLSAIGTAPVPGASILLLGGVLVSIGVPVEGIAIIFPIDRVLDMCRTAVNVTGDVMAAVVVDNMDKSFNKAKYLAKV